jgi:multidrug efflux pump subunit AcrA (membrane-fusion protein)
MQPRRPQCHGCAERGFAMKSIGLSISMGMTAAAALAFTGGLAQTPEVLAAEQTATPAAQVAAVRAVSACFSAVVRATGFLLAREEAMVFLDAPGFKVTEVLAREGDRVTSGQILARLTRQADGPETPAAGRPTTATLKAPSTGVVTHGAAVIGTVASVAMPEPLFRIAINNEIELEVEVSSIHVPELASGQTARVEIEDGRALSGRVRQVPGEIDQRTQLGRARISFEGDPSLRIGMFAKASVDANRSCGISVPTSAVFHRTEGTSVQVVRDATVETRLVQVGLHSDTQTEIRDGLREGDVVVANAGSSLHDGDKVTVIFADGTQLGLR